MLAMQVVFCQFQRQVVYDAAEGVSGNMINVATFDRPAVEQGQCALIVDAFLTPLYRIINGQISKHQSAQIGIVSLTPGALNLHQMSRVWLMQKCRQALIELLSTLCCLSQAGVSGQPQIRLETAVIVTGNAALRVRFVAGQLALG